MAMMYSFPYFEPVHCSMSKSNYSFLSCIKICIWIKQRQKGRWDDWRVVKRWWLGQTDSLVFLFLKCYRFRIPLLFNSIQWTRVTKKPFPRAGVSLPPWMATVYAGVASSHDFIMKTHVRQHKRGSFKTLEDPIIEHSMLRDNWKLSENTLNILEYSWKTYSSC